MKKEIALKLLKMGIATIKQIAKATKLGVDEIEKLNQELQDKK